MTIAGEQASFQGAGTVWTTTFQPEPIVRAAPDQLNALAPLIVNAHLANFPDVTLDDPRTVEVYDDPPTDPPNHMIRIHYYNGKPRISGGVPEWRADLSDEIRIQVAGVEFVDDGAWLGVFPVESGNSIENAIETAAVPTAATQDVRFQMPAKGAYSVRLFDGPEGAELARDEFKVCVYSEEFGYDCERE